MTSSDFIRQLEDVLRPYGQGSAKFGYHKYENKDQIVIEESANKDKINTTQQIILNKDFEGIVGCLCLQAGNKTHPNYVKEGEKLSIRKIPEAVIFIPTDERSITVVIVELKSYNSERDDVLTKFRGGLAIAEYVRLLTANLVRNSNWYSLNFRFIGVEFKRPKPAPPTTELVDDPLSESKHTDFVENAENNLVTDEVHPALRTYANPFPSVEAKDGAVKEYPLTQLLAGVVKQ